MLKLVGGIIIFIAATVYGMNIYANLNERRRMLSELLFNTQCMEQKLRCLRMPLYECFEQGDGIFRDAAKLMRSGYTPAQAVICAADKCKAADKSDKELIYHFAKGLSAQDCEGQLANIRLFEKNLERNVSSAEKSVNIKGKLAVQGSMLAGAAAAIILL